jgi:hypothetical protein
MFEVVDLDGKRIDKVLASARGQAHGAAPDSRGSPSRAEA